MAHAYSNMDLTCLFVTHLFCSNVKIDFRNIDAVPKVWGNIIVVKKQLNVFEIFYIKNKIFFCWRATTVIFLNPSHFTYDKNTWHVILKSGFEYWGAALINLKEVLPSQHIIFVILVTFYGIPNTTSLRLTTKIFMS